MLKRKISFSSTSQLKLNYFQKLLNQAFSILSSLKMAIFILSALVVSLVTATTLESMYDTPTAQYWVYRSQFFYGLMIALGLNIFFVATSRLPWKKKHIPFLLAHLGILILLLGSWITDRAGIDGSMRLTEGESSAAVDLDQNSLIIGEKDHLYSYIIPWQPPGVDFHKIDLNQVKLPAGIVPVSLIIDQYISRAEQKVSFLPHQGAHLSDLTRQQKASPAIQIKLTGGPMNMSQKVWLWQGSPSWNDIQAGPSRIFMNDGTFKKDFKGPQLEFKKLSNGDLKYVALSSSQQKVEGVLKKNKILGHVIQPGWKGNVEITVLNWIEDAKIVSEYVPARIQYGQKAPLSAIHIVAGPSHLSLNDRADQDHLKTDVWLGLGEKAVLRVDGREIELGYFSKRVMLPFSLKLDQFKIEYDPGTFQAAAYSSWVQVVDGTFNPEATKAHVSMNEPFDYKNYTFYQASYEEGDEADRPKVSIFSVNRDPGRIWKYTGSALIVLGSILLFAVKYKRSYQQKKIRGNSVL